MKTVLSILAILAVVATLLLFHHRRPPPPSITGIGVAVTVANHSLKIMDVRPNTPAARAGLVRGLIIQRIDDSSTEGRSLKECVALMRGPIGSQVQLELVDPVKSSTNMVTFTRELIPLPTAGSPPPRVTQVP